METRIQRRRVNNDLIHINFLWNNEDVLELVVCEFIEKGYYPFAVTCKKWKTLYNTAFAVRNKKLGKYTHLEDLKKTDYLAFFRDLSNFTYLETVYNVKPILQIKTYVIYQDGLKRHRTDTINRFEFGVSKRGGCDLVKHLLKKKRIKNSPSLWYGAIAGARVDLLEFLDLEKPEAVVPEVELSYLFGHRNSRKDEIVAFLNENPGTQTGPAFMNAIVQNLEENADLLVPNMCAEAKENCLIFGMAYRREWVVDLLHESVTPESLEESSYPEEITRYVLTKGYVQPSLKIFRCIATSRPATFYYVEAFFERHKDIFKGADVVEMVEEVRRGYSFYECNKRDIIEFIKRVCSKS
jgi:hypothetical protein